MSVSLLDDESMLQHTVMAIAIPMKSMNTGNSIGTVPSSSENSLYKPHAIAQPKPNGKIIPAVPTLNATLQLPKKTRRSTSSPTKNKNSTNPRLAMRLRFGMEAVGNMASVKPGMRPITVGPSMIPPITSAITRGCFIFDSGQWRSRQNMMMIPAWMMNNVIGLFGS